ncbi:MAG TPA: exopolysaccharide biosynthesis protein [Reyranella sp.]|nr:exopolysaccharide biosynthesis protein [Reyranella sp.]
MHTPTSIELSQMLDRARDPRVPVAWVIEQLGRRSFGLTFLALGVVALLPGASTLVGVLLAWPAIQLLLGHDVTALPRVVARRTVSVDRLARVIGRLRPRLEWLERLIRPRWPDLFRTTRWMTGLVMLLLGLTMVSPVPFGHVVPALVVMLLAVAYMEEDGLALLVALVGALVSLAITAATVWGTVATVDWLDPATRA